MPINQVDEFKYLGVLLHATKGLSPALEFLCKAARRAMFGVQSRCQQLHIHDPVLKCKLFDTLVKPILSYCCEVWSSMACKTALDSLERLEIGFLKVLLGVQVHTKTLHVLAEFGRYPLHLTWHKQAANCLRRLETMSPDRLLKQAFLADCRLPDNVSWRARLVNQLGDSLVSAPSDDNQDLQMFDMPRARAAFASQIQTDSSSKTKMYKDIKADYVCEPYIQQCHNRHLRRIVAQFRTGSHWLHIETGRHKNTAKEERSCPLCAKRRVINDQNIPAEQFDSFDSDEEAADPIEDEHHVVLMCPSYAYVRTLFPDLFGPEISSVGDFVNQSNCNRVAKFLTWVRHVRMNIA